MKQIFISHKSDDVEQALAIAGRLREAGYPDVFLDALPDGLVPGVDWEAELYRRLRDCRVLLLLCSKRSLESRWCFGEFAVAKVLNKPIIPVRLDDCTPAGVIGRVQRCDWRPDAVAQDEAIDRIVEGLEELGLRPVRSGEWDQPPYPGLRSFEAHEEAIFFGRERESGRCLALLDLFRPSPQPQLALLLGPSGSGKSSVMRAGVVPQLRRSPHRVVVGPFRPGGDPARSLQLALEEAHRRLAPEGGDPAAPDPPPPRADLSRLLDGDERRTVDAAADALGRWAESLAERKSRLLASDVEDRDGAAEELLAQSRELVARMARLMDGESEHELRRAATRLARLARTLARERREARNDRPTVLLVIDQLEELLQTRREREYGPAEAEPLRAEPARRFADLLRRALDHPRIALLATLRTDYLNAFQGHPAFHDLDWESVPVDPLPLDRVREVISGPAREAGLDVQKELVDALEQAARQNDALPLLAYTLRELYDRSPRRITLKQYRDLGGLGGVIDLAAEEAVAEAQRSRGGLDEEALRDALLAMVRRDPSSGQWVRKPTSPRLKKKNLGEGVWNALEGLRSKGLLIPEEGPGLRLRIGHEALLRNWQRLRKWLEQDEAFLRWRDELGDRMRLGERLRGPALEEAVSRSAGRKLTDEEENFLRASLLDSERRRQAELDRRRREEEGLAELLAERGEAAASEGDLLGAELLFASALARHPHEPHHELFAEPRSGEDRERLARGLRRILGGLHRSRADFRLRQEVVIEDERLADASAFGFAGNGWLVTGARPRAGGPGGKLLVTDLEARQTTVLDPCAPGAGLHLAVGGSLVAAILGRTARLWSITEGRLLAERRVVHMALELHITADDGFLLVQSGGVKAYSLPDLEPVEGLRLGSRYRALATVPGQPWLVASGPKVRVIDLRDPARSSECEAEAAVTAVAVSSGSRLVAHADRELRITLLFLPRQDSSGVFDNFRAGGERRGAHERRIRRLGFSPDGSLLASEDAGGTTLWRIRGTGDEMDSRFTVEDLALEKLRTLRGRLPRFGAVFSASGRLLTVDDVSARVHRPDGALIGSVPCRGLAGFEPGGENLVVYHRAGVTRWAVDEAVPTRLESCCRRSHAVAFSDRRPGLLLTLDQPSPKGAPRLLSFETGDPRPQERRLAREPTVLAACLGRDDRLALLARRGRAAVVRILDAAGEPLGDFEYPHLPGPFRGPPYLPPRYALALHPTQDLVVLGERLEMRDFSGNTVAALRREGEWPQALAFSPDGRLLAAGDAPSDLEIWDVEKRSFVKPLESASPESQIEDREPQIEGLAFDAGGERLAAAGRWHGGEVALFCRQRGWQRRDIGRPGGRAAAADFSPDGGILVTAEGYRPRRAPDADHSVRFWDIETGALVQEDRVPAPLSRVLFDPTGRRVAAAAAGDVFLLPVRYEPLRGTPSEALAEAERRSGRRLEE